MPVPNPMITRQQFPMGSSMQSPMFRPQVGATGMAQGGVGGGGGTGGTGSTPLEEAARNEAIKTLMMRMKQGKEGGGAGAGMAGGMMGGGGGTGGYMGGGAASGASLAI